MKRLSAVISSQPGGSGRWQGEATKGKPFQITNFTNFNSFYTTLPHKRAKFEVVVQCSNKANQDSKGTTCLSELRKFKKRDNMFVRIYETLKKGQNVRQNLWNFKKGTIFCQNLWNLKKRKIFLSEFRKFQKVNNMFMRL